MDELEETAHVVRVRGPTHELTDIHTAVHNELPCHEIPEQLFIDRRAQPQDFVGGGTARQYEKLDIRAAQTVEVVEVEQVKEELQLTFEVAATE